jgi:single-strand selective monofunctional uracil DNA glycosylase
VSFDTISYERIIDGLSRKLAKQTFAPPITHVYNPLVYARAPHLDYVRKHAKHGVKAVLLGMNPGPWGMTQTGVPFGEIGLVRDWLSVRGEVTRPKKEHPDRPIEGFDCARSEVSGARLWGFARDRFKEPARFFSDFFVVNYCPLVFMEASGKNFTPDKLPVSEQAALFKACDQALAEIIRLLAPKWVIGVGAFAEQRAKAALDDSYQFGRVLHPSPASPAANKDWSGACARTLSSYGLI